MPPIPLIYALHSGNLYGTERMAIATAQALAGPYAPVILAPPGPAAALARESGLDARTFSGAADFARLLRPLLAIRTPAAFLATGVVHSLAAIFCQVTGCRPVAHLHIVHGGADERLSYGRKRLLNRMGVRFVAVSEFVRSRLVAHGVRGDKICVIENFLSEECRQQAPRRAVFDRIGVRRLIVVSRLDPIKRLDLLLDAITVDPALNSLKIHIFGTGSDEAALRERVRHAHPNVTLRGFSGRIPEELAASDLLVHLCPTEPFGLAILESMAARVPVLVPNAGGAGALVTPGVSGFHFSAGDAVALAAALRRLQEAPASLLNQAVCGGRQALASRFSAQAQAAAYNRLIQEELE